MTGEKSDVPYSTIWHDIMDDGCGRGEVVVSCKRVMQSKSRLRHNVTN